MAGKLESLRGESPRAAEEAESGQAKSSRSTEELLAMVMRLQKDKREPPLPPVAACRRRGLGLLPKLKLEGSLEPQIEDLINRINELQQEKKKSGEELGETRALWEALRRELDSLNEEKVHLEEVLSKKKEALKILQLQEKKSEAQRLDVEEALEDVMGQHKDLWEFHMLQQRLAREIRALERSKEQLQAERKLVSTKLQVVERKLRSPPQVEGSGAVNEGPPGLSLLPPLPLLRRLKAGLGKFGEQVWSAPEAGAGRGEAEPEVPGACEEENLRPPAGDPDTH
ncbi:synaptonemal complex central element protein 1-like isoform X3 [Nycticebus coucang]|uniref:synaptonemal complex central element protein 1-like isoform X3 n=1 Tax=Nycticebus coucang TaxID=9470 RepID=UPI00234CC1D5|nr:synaptonemal complex central element protein 1-like isoform X3 [Nycticebus coucang]